MGFIDNSARRASVRQSSIRRSISSLVVIASKSFVTVKGSITLPASASSSSDDLLSIATSIAFSNSSIEVPVATGSEGGVSSMFRKSVLKASSVSSEFRALNFLGTNSSSGSESSSKPSSNLTSEILTSPIACLSIVGSSFRTSEMTSDEI
ncbi:hypothetical protein IMSAGC004_00548 [Bacteroidaceae bacterium]|nr:hypothetical protein IMSAGC004_00548 [Bacteroidaceae bacterium]